MTPAGAWSVAGAVLGLLAGTGAVLLLAGLRRLRRPTLDDRLAPYLRDSGPSTLLLEPAASATPPSLRLALAVLARRDLAWVGRITGDSDAGRSVRRRLDQLGGSRTVEQFRAEQVLCGAAGAVAGTASGLLLTAGRPRAAIPVLALLVIGGLLGVLGRDTWLTHQVRRREARMLAEFPAVAELLALSVGAGEGAAGALERVSRTCRGELAAELARVTADVRAGTPVETALDRLATRASLPSLARFVDGMTVAMRRGTPLADVLRAQAQDVRELSRQRLIESGGRREIAMTVPVVFLVLPVTVLFAVFPGLAILDLGG
jgi:tight adherence protein C